MVGRPKGDTVDTPEQMEMCQKCPFPECIDCINKQYKSRAYRNPEIAYRAITEKWDLAQIASAFGVSTATAYRYKKLWLNNITVTDRKEKALSKSLHKSGGCFCRECRYYKGDYCRRRKPEMMPPFGFCSKGITKGDDADA